MVRDNKLGQPGKPQFKILAPSRREIPKGLTRAAVSCASHAELMFGLQMLRGNVYREYAGIAATLQPDGRHHHHLDDQSWHIILQDAEGEIVGCARYRPIHGGFEQLICSKAAIALSPVTGPVFRSAFAQQVSDARRRGLHYGEASAWALSEKARCSTAAVNIALMSFALAEALGGGVGLTTASTRHHASLILRRLGGSPLAGFAPYYEPMFDCSIELLHFDISQLEPRYESKLAEMREEVQKAPLLCPIEVAPEVKHPLMSMDLPAYLPNPAQYQMPSGIPLR